MITLTLIVVMTLAISSMCSLFEAALYSTRTSVLEATRSDPKIGDTAKRFLSMKRNIARPTAAILILNTVANTAGATLAGMYAARELGVAAIPIFSHRPDVVDFIFRGNPAEDIRSGSLEATLGQDRESIACAGGNSRTGDHRYTEIFLAVYFFRWITHEPGHGRRNSRHDQDRYPYRRCHSC